MANEDELNKWLKFLDPENLKGNLVFSSLFIASFEAFKDHTIETVKFFFNTGFINGEYTFSDTYEKDVKSKDKSVLKATLLWLKDMGAITTEDIAKVDELRQYRNKLSHELMALLFEGLPQEFPEKLADLILLRVKIEKWWTLNIEIPTNPDFDSEEEISEKDILTPSQIFHQLVFDMLSGDEKTAHYYQEEFKKRFKK
ncbi:hypothetical protein RT717_11990 [Imperialibacter roseus]|uniref:DUF4145 domain-containing protein n=1 Tax=Imperialibacter roseus TaxID=1324217 RepID=A0ABZ0IWC1_9BACT|nr:hypothetical protein [Imperialibacter roseus]WOK09360.1 hypothetical protein RT717_11990 [Imperialibacter roseus]